MRKNTLFSKWMAFLMASAMLASMIPSQTVWASEAEMPHEGEPVQTVEEIMPAADEEADAAETVEIDSEIAEEEEIIDVGSVTAPEAGVTITNPKKFSLSKRVISVVGWQDTLYMAFECPQDGYYTFYSEGDSDTFARLKGPNAEIIAEDDDTGEDYNFEISRMLLQAGEYYILEVECYDTSYLLSGNIVLKVDALFGTIGLNAPVVLKEDNDKHYLFFTPEESGNYQFYSRSTQGDPEGTLFIGDGTDILANNDDEEGIDTLDFRIKSVFLEAGKEYYLSVRNRSDEADLSASIYWAFEREAANIKKIENTEDGIKITADADFCEIYRRESTSQAWTKVGFTDGGVFVDEYAKAGKVYYYTIREMVDEIGTYRGPINPGSKSIRRLTAITPTVSNGSAGVGIRWTQVTGAAGYYVYRKTGSGSYTRLATITDGSTVFYADKTAVSGTTYTYAVKAYNGSSYGAYTGKAICYLKAITPTLANASGGIQVKWTAVTGAEKYRVYRKTGTGSYSLITTVTGTSYTDTAIASKNGTSYTYAVRAVKGSTLGAYTAKTMVRLTKVTLSASPKSRSMSISWTRNTTASGYQYEYSTASNFSGGTFVAVSGGTTLSKTISGLTKGKTYYVRVRAYKTVGGVKYYGAWSNTASGKVK